MTTNELKEVIEEQVGDKEIFDKIAFLDSEACSHAAIGLSTNHNIIYDYDKMVEGHMTYDNMTYEEAIDWIDYNTIRTVQHLAARPDTIEPIILHNFIY